MREKTLTSLPSSKVTSATSPTSTSITSLPTSSLNIASLATPAGNNSIKTAALQSGILTSTDNSALQSFDDDENEWELGVGNLIIDLDADLEKNEKDPILPQHSSMSGPGMEHQATVDKGLKMKIKRKKETANSNNSNKHEIVRDKLNNENKDLNKPSPDTKSTKRTVKKDKGAKDTTKKDISNGFTQEPQPGAVKSEDPYEFNAKVEDRISVPVKKIKIEKGATPPGSPPAKPAPPFSVPEPQPASSSHVPVVLLAQPATLHGPAVTHGPVVRKDASTDMQDSSTITEPDCLGPCEPGTSVTLEGIVWQETENGVLVVNVTWRGKTYVGTLLDATRHDWAPPRFNCESPTSESPKGRGVKRNCRGSVSSTPVDNVIETRKLRKGRRGARNFTAPPSPAKSDITPVSSVKRKGRPNDLDLCTDDLKNKQRCRSNSRGTPTEPELKPNAQGYIECPEPNCSKKYKHINGLRYHQSHAHGAPEGSESKSSNDSSESRPPTPATPSGKEIKRTKSKEKEIKDSKKESDKDNETEDEKNKNKDKPKKVKSSNGESNQKPGDSVPKEKKNKHKKKKDREKERSKSPKCAKEDASNDVQTVISETSNIPKAPSTPQASAENEELATDSVHSPAYSDISDAAESGPTAVEPETTDKPSETSTTEAASSEPSKSSTPVPTSAPFNMYSYYGQPPYLIPSMASKSQQDSPSSTPKPENQPPTDAKTEKTREDPKVQKEKESGEQVPALCPTSQSPIPILTAYGYIDPAYHHHLLSSDPRYRETHEKFVEKQKQAKSGAKKDDNASLSSPAEVNKPKEPEPPKDNKPTDKSRDDLKSSEPRIKTEPHDSLYERQQEDLKRFYMYQQKQQERKPEDQQSRHEEDRRAVLAIKQEPKSVIEHRPREPEKSTSVIKEPIPAQKPDLKRSATPQDKAVQEKRAKLERVSPATTPKTSKPSTPTMISPYGQYAVPPGFIQGYGQVQIDPHGPYRGVGVFPTLGYQPHPTAYMHQAMRYHQMSAMDKDKQILMSPGARHPSLSEPPKALDLLQQHASHYYNNSQQQQHKIHELEKAARPDTASPPTKPRTDGSPLPLSLSKAKDLTLGRPVSPPPQRHVHTHHHTHLVGGVGGYPIYDHYGAIINPNQGPPSNLPPGTMGHPYPPK